MWHDGRVRTIGMVVLLCSGVASADRQTLDRGWPAVPPSHELSMEDQLTHRIDEWSNTMGQHLGQLSHDAVAIELDLRRNRARMRLGYGNDHYLSLRVDSRFEFHDGLASVDARVDLSVHGHAIRSSCRASTSCRRAQATTATSRSACRSTSARSSDSRGSGVRCRFRLRLRPSVSVSATATATAVAVGLGRCLPPAAFGVGPDAAVELPLAVLPGLARALALPVTGDPFVRVVVPAPVAARPDVAGVRVVTLLARRRRRFTRATPTAAAARC